MQQYPLILLKEDCMPSPIAGNCEFNLQEYINNEVDDNIVIIKKELLKIAQDPIKFFDHLAEHFECGATIETIEFTRADVESLTKQAVY